MQNFSGRTYAVLGASGHLGSAVAGLLRERGAAVVLLDRSSRETAADDERVLALAGLDLTDPAALGQALDGAVGRFGRLDGLVATVGGFRMGGTDAEDGWGVWDTMISANLKTVVAGVQAAVPRLTSEGGRIVTVGARPALAAGKGMAAYSASKAALLRLTESLAEELKGKGITVNSVLPSIIDTPANRKDMPDADHSRWVPPGDIAEVIAFLLSDAARSVTGAHIPVFGRT